MNRLHSNTYIPTHIYLCCCLAAAASAAAVAAAAPAAVAAVLLMVGFYALISDFCVFVVIL